MILSDFYTAILDRLIAANIGIRFFDLYAGQLDANDEELPYNRPAVFFQYDPIAWDTLGQSRQEADASFSLIVVSDVIKEISSREQPATRTAGLAHLQLLDNIHATLQGWNGNAISKKFGSITRTGLTPYSEIGANEEGYNRMVHVMTFRVRIVDDAALVTYETADPQPSLEITTDFEP